MSTELDPILSKRQVSDCIGVHITTLDRWCAAGAFVPRIKIGASKIGFSRAAVALWLANR